MPDSHPHNRRTVAGYENCARDYATSVPQQPPEPAASAMRHLAELLPPGGRVLDIGSGPGWDADFLEGLGLRVHRTEATAAFRDFQAERGQRVDALDLLTDEIAARYDGILLQYVLQHFERADLDGALRKMADALTDRGAILLSYPLGEGEHWDHGASGDYRVVLWSAAAMDERLQGLGLSVVWEAQQDGRDGPWRTLIARTAA